MLNASIIFILKWKCDLDHRFGNNLQSVSPGSLSLGFAPRSSLPATARLAVAASPVGYGQRATPRPATSSQASSLKPLVSSLPLASRRPVRRRAWRFSFLSSLFAPRSSLFSVLSVLSVVFPSLSLRPWRLCGFLPTHRSPLTADCSPVYPAKGGAHPAHQAKAPAFPFP